MSIQPFRIDVSQVILDDLRLRLANTRWADTVENAGWNYGTDRDYLQELVRYWQEDFDWRQQEAMLNGFPQFRADLDGCGVHFLQVRGKGPSPSPLLLLHGWPDSFFRMIKLIPLLTDPERYGGKAEDSFDVVVPSLPGYGFSNKPLQTGFDIKATADLLANLMTKELGYERFAVHGGDIGSGVTETLASLHPESLSGIHLTDIPYWHLFTIQSTELSEAEKNYLEAGQQWSKTEGAYAMLQGTKPQTLAYGLNDSPVGLAAWIVEKFRSWSDGDGDIEKRFTKDELLTNIMIYWVTQTIYSSFLPYYTGQHSTKLGTETRIEVPTGVAIFPKDLIPAPREFAERFFNIQHWTKMPRGGHFAALEEPELLAEDLRGFIRPLR